MRIIAGKFGGRVLTTVRDNSVRPATDRVKGSIFNMLQNRLALSGARVLDLFAGSGSLGFEALSRGANRVVFVDESNVVLDVVGENAEKLNCVDSCEIVQTDALSYIERVGEQFDLIFADPPYAYEGTQEIPLLVFQQKLLKKGGFLIMEHTKRLKIPPSALYQIVIQKDFGNTQVSFFVHTE
ncbi:MAG: 16S rRNA (guanine(966)-N(2))-methyltransferase RsmD [Ignavibacteria bacterium]|nr:16S rRNA (guanine(966)-N(2))-methyltransferase RsmD [Ignavibacteria bacterium]MBI3766766.1 16S rRNA (guanine(966)-N(2))-methyltransferase RsmD [Ignavibacteriales bacterium]